MSYQPDPSGGDQPTSPFGVPSAVPPPPAAPQYAYGYPPATIPTSPSGAPGKRRKGVLLTGIAVVILGLVAGVVMVALSGSAEEKTVKAFARAPVGCTTTLEFERRATFTIYIETAGSLGTIDGDCVTGGTSYQRGSDDLPRVSLTLLNSDDQEVALTATDAPTYTVGDFAGQGYQRVQITKPGTYRLTVTSDDTDFAIAVGGKPNADANAMSLAGVGAALAGLLLGGLLVVLGLRRKKSNEPTSVASGSSAPWQPTPTGVPGWQPHQPAAVPGSDLAHPAAPFVPISPTGPPTPPTAPGWGAPQQ